MSGDLQSRADRLAQRLDAAAPEAWKPSAEGDQIVGVYRRLEGPKWDRFRGEVYVAIFEEPTSGREFSVWLLHTALVNEMKRKRPQIGELVAIRYLGKVPPKSGGQPYDGYRVEVERQPGLVDEWDRVAGVNGEGQPGEPEAAPAVGAPEVCPECGAYLESQPHEVWCSHA